MPFLFLLNISQAIPLKIYVLITDQILEHESLKLASFFRFNSIAFYNWNRRVVKYILHSFPKNLTKMTEKEFLRYKKPWAHKNSKEMGEKTIATKIWKLESRWLSDKWLSKH